MTVLTEKGHSTTETASKICVSFYVKKRKEKKSKEVCFFIAPFTQPILLQVTLNSEELLSRKRYTGRDKATKR